MEECFNLVERIIDEYVPKMFLSLKSNPAARGTLKKICDLLDDIVKIVNIEIPRNYRVEEIMRFCTPLTLMMIVRPAMDHLLTAYVFGAYPLCYQSIRMSTEALAYSLYVDLSMPLSNDSIFLEKLLKFQKYYLKKRRISTSKLIKNLSNVVGKELSRKMRKIWHETSNSFLHFKGYLDKMLKWHSDNPPSCLVGAFVGYDDADEPCLNELRKVVEEFRELLKETWSFWKNWHNKQATQKL
jgi:hypothetical protein